MQVVGPGPILKEVKSANFLFFRKELKLDELETMVPVSQEVYREAMRRDLKITGPVHWHYMGMVDQVKPFTLEVSLPVDQVAKDYDGSFHFKRTTPFKCVSLTHEGSFDDLLKSYDCLFEFIHANKLQPTGMTREVYINVDFGHPEANITDVQIGIK